VDVGAVWCGLSHVDRRGEQMTTPHPTTPDGSDRLWGGELALPLGLGTNTFGRTTDATGAHAVLDRFEAAGGRLIDTADTYSDGAAESILGTWLRQRGNRDRVLVATKVGNHPRFDGLSASVVTASVEESLRRLDTDHIDLYFAHYQDDLTPVEESAAAFDALVRAGKIRAIGLSNFDADTVDAWLTARPGSPAARPPPALRCFPTAHSEAASCPASTGPTPTPRAGLAAPE
jgi:aryl-alcohol dehydrogenase-like predicted oxidoreductase